MATLVGVIASRRSPGFLPGTAFSLDDLSEASFDWGHSAFSVRERRRSIFRSNLGPASRCHEERDAG